MPHLELHQTAQLINTGIFRRITLRKDLNGKIKQVDIRGKLQPFLPASFVSFIEQSIAAQHDIFTTKNLWFAVGTLRCTFMGDGHGYGHSAALSVSSVRVTS